MANRQSKHPVKLVLGMFATLGIASAIFGSTLYNSKVNQEQMADMQDNVTKKIEQSDKNEKTTNANALSVGDSITIEPDGKDSLQPAIVTENTRDGIFVKGEDGKTYELEGKLSK